MASQAPNPYTRRSERLLWLRRAVAWALVAGALALAAIYWRQRRHQPHPEAPLLGLEIQQSAAGVDIIKSEGGRPIFRVHAARANKLRPGGEDELRQVSIWVYDQTGKHADEITGDAFRYDESSGELHAAGLVHIQLERQLAISARGLSYNVKQGRGSIAQGVAFAMGAAQGSAGSAQLDSRTNLAEFSGGVQLRWQRADGQLLTLASQTAQLQRLPQGPDAACIRLRGQARLVMGGQRLAAPELVVYVRPDYSLRHVDALGGLVAGSAARGEALRVQAAAGHADFTAAATQRLAHLELDGQVAAEQTYLAGPAPQQRRLQAGQMLLRFSAAGELQEIQARQGAALTQTGTGGGRLAAAELDFTFHSNSSPANHNLPSLAAIRSQGRTQMSRGALTAEADRVQLDLGAGQQPQRALATGSVVVHQQVNGELRTSQCRRLEIQFGPGQGAQPQIASLQESGGVELQAGGRRISSQTLRYTPADGKAVFAGGVRGSDPQAQFRAAEATWVRTATGASTLRAHGSGSRPLALSLLGNGGQAATAAMAPLLSSAQPVVVSARDLVWEEPAGSPAGASPEFRGTARFTGTVRLLQAPNVLRADQLALQAGAAGSAPSLQASGHVQTDFVASGGAARGGLSPLEPGHATQARAVSITAAALQYSAATQQARYSGGVTMRVDAATLQAPLLSVYFAPGSARTTGVGRLLRAVASGGVLIRQPGRRAQAQQLSFDFARNLVQLAGGPPSIFDAEQGRITGDPLTFSLANDEIQVGGKLGTRVSGQTGGHN